MKIIELRSDTCSEPNEAMRQAIYRAEIGNDSWGEDPSVNALQDMVCEATGKEAALFMSSCTMCNLAAGMTYAHSVPLGAEVLIGDYMHTYWYEVGGLSTLAHMSIRTVDCGEEYMPLKAVEDAIRPLNGHMPKTELLWLENTYMLDSGLPIPPETMKPLYELAHSRGIKVHLDGARIFNAAYALGVEVKDIAQYCDSVSVCMSKGIGAPYGAVLAGSKEFIQQVVRARQTLGGGMRQIGFMAAAGIYGLEHISETIPDAHRRCRMLAEALNDIYPESVNLAKTLTNICMFDAEKAGYTADEYRDLLWEKNIRVLVTPTKQGMRCRFMFYPGIEDADVEYVIETVRAIGSK